MTRCGCKWGEQQGRTGQNSNFGKRSPFHSVSAHLLVWTSGILGGLNGWGSFLQRVCRPGTFTSALAPSASLIPARRVPSPRASSIRQPQVTQGYFLELQRRRECLLVSVKACQHQRSDLSLTSFPQPNTMSPLRAFPLLLLILQLGLGSGALSSGLKPFRGCAYLRLVHHECASRGY